MHVHACILRYIHAYVHLHLINMCIQTFAQCTNAYTHTHVHTYMRTCVSTHGAILANTLSCELYLGTWLVRFLLSACFGNADSHKVLENSATAVAFVMAPYVMRIGRGKLHLLIRCDQGGRIQLRDLLKASTVPNCCNFACDRTAAQSGSSVPNARPLRATL